MKIAAIEAMWDTEPAPASFTVFGFPDIGDAHDPRYAIKVPWVLGLIATRSLDKPIAGHPRTGRRARKAHRATASSPTARCSSCAQPRRRRRGAANSTSHVARSRLCAAAEEHTRRYRQRDRRPRSSRRPDDTVPDVPVLFWSFRFMVGFGFYFIALFAVAFYFASQAPTSSDRWFLRIALWSLPLPWLAAELGWFVAEYGRQPWVIDGVLPTFLARLQPPGRQCLLQSRRLCAVLQHARDRRCLSDGANTSGSGPEARRCPGSAVSSRRRED